MSSRRTVVVLTPGKGHLQRLVPVIEGLVRRGVQVHVMTRAGSRPQVEAAGGIFFDLFAAYPIEAVDQESVPLPCRFVTSAAAYARPLTEQIARLGPCLIVYDSFAVVAPIVARQLGIPYVGMRAGHSQLPARAIAETRRDPRVVISEACRAAVEQLREEYGVEDASPFSYLAGVSPFLNLYPEPAQFIDEDARTAFEPIAFFGSLAPGARDRASRERPMSGATRFRIYMSFGTVIWQYHAPVALDAMACIADAFVGEDIDMLVTLGQYDDPAAVRRLERPNVRVVTYVDQWGVLKDADVFVTHHGLNSTHEAIYHGVPMLSYPFLGDQPAMAACCERLGVAMPLAGAPLAPLDVEMVRGRLDAARRTRTEMLAHLADARRGELETMAGRENVLDRMMELV